MNELSGGTNQLDGWPELPDGVQGLPDFPTEALPDDLSLLVRMLAAAVQVDEAMAAGFALGLASAAIVGRVEIQPKQSEPWHTEAGQLFILCQGESGERKTPVLRALKAPLESWLDEQRQGVRAANRRIMNRVEAIRAACRRERDPGRAAALADEADKLADSLEAEPEFLLGDLTPEAVGKAAEDHAGRVAIVRDEADFLDALTGDSAYGKGAAVNLGAILNGYTNEAFHGQRIGRGEWHLPRCSVAICLGVQPGILRRFAADADGTDRGLQPRFLYFLPSSKIGKRRDRGGPLPSSVLAWWEKAIRRLASIARTGEPLRLCFDSFADAARGAFFERIEPRLLTDLGGPLKAWGGKLVGNTVRLAGLLALLEGRDEVTRSCWDAAETIAEQYLTPCAVRLFRGADPALGGEARKLLGLIREIPSFIEADLWRDKGRYAFQNQRDEFSRALLDLCGKGYIRQGQREEASTGRKPSPLWDVNPALHRKAAPEGEVIAL